jgi:hypothetical protein
MKQVFIGFYGWPTPPMKQDENILKIDEGFECWNLKKFSVEEFIEAVKEKIPPINDNVLRNYLTDGKGLNGLNQEQYGHCLWGLLLPSLEEGFDMIGYKKALSILNLFSPKFMHPAFYITNMGIEKIDNFKEINVQPNDHQGYDFFKTSEFISFYKAMLDQMKYFNWWRDAVLTWTDEDWRLFMAAGFYEDLEKYERSKTSYTWQRESADMATLLETLFTAGDAQNEEIGYRLRKRIGVLIGWKIPDIENEIKILYNDRSEFIHGSYYKKITKGMKKNEYDNAMPPLPDFDKLYKTKEVLRMIFVAYLYLSKIKSEKKYFTEYSNVQSLLEESILNIELRQKVTDIVKPIIELLPNKNSF